MTLPPLNAAEFEAVFIAVHGCRPFPWQARLARLLADTGRWPDALDLPTGSGKTAAIDVALFHLALEADRGSERRAPVRIAFVVDRRIIVDEAADRAARIADALAQATGDDPLARMATRLRHLAGDATPVVVRSLRGGIPREDDWTRTPGQPTVLCSTVDQVGSRLLFRGYGVSDGMKPVHAGLLGSDCLFLLDEAHLAAPFAQTLTRVAAYRAPPWCETSPAPWRFVGLSATPQTGAAAFGLAADDHDHPILKRRLRAAKPAALRALTCSAKDQPREHAEAFAQNAWRMFEGGAVRTLAIVVNRVGLARAVFEALRTKAEEVADVVLLTGRVRGIDRDTLIGEIEHRLKSGAEAIGRPLFVVATQTIEAGADFDFDALVTQIAPLDALRQRFGRLNRMGRDIHAMAAILAAKDEIGSRSTDAVYGDRAKKTWDWLTDVAGKPEKKGADPVIDFGIDAFSVRLGDDKVAGLASEKPDAPVLRPADVMLLSWTAPIPAVDPAIALFLHGPKAGAADVQIVWRADMKEDTLDSYGEVLALVPPHAGETLAVPLWAARAWLAGAGQQAAETADVEGAPAPDLTGKETAVHRAFRWAGPDAAATGAIPAGALRPGDVIVVPAAWGGCDRFGWNPASPTPVRDLGDDRPPSRRWVKRLHPDLVPDIWDAIASAASSDGDQTSAERLASLQSAGIAIEGQNCTIHWPEGYEGAVLLSVRPNQRTFAAVTEDDESGSLTGEGLALARHGLDVEAKAAAFAPVAGLTPERSADVALAALLHDEGKADPRFQTWLRGGDRLMAVIAGGEALAKSPRLMSVDESRVARRTAGLPDRWRHEAQSVTRAIADPRFQAANDPELVLWLIGVHHGHGRPLFPHHDPRETPDRLGPQRLDFQFQGHDWPQIFERLKARYGPWELARMEAIVRLADHRASEEAGR